MSLEDITTQVTDLATSIADLTTAVEGDRAASAADKASAAADAALTAADRIATDADATATGADATATAADRVQTGLDATATAADRVQTGLDAVSTNADAVSSSNSEANALAHKNDAQAAVTTTLTYRDQTQGYATTAAAEAANAAANSSAQNLAGMVNVALPMTVLGVTIPDPLGYAPWRFNRTLSWYTEARSTGPYLGAFSSVANAWADPDAAAGCFYHNTSSGLFKELTGTSTDATTYRAGTAYFPAQHAVSWEAGRVVIWDISGQTPTMWMVLDSTYLGILSGAGGYPFSCAKFSQGELFVGSSVGLVRLNFATEKQTTYDVAGNSGVYSGPGISSRNIPGSHTPSADASKALPSRIVNDLAITTLPNAPIDPKTGLKIPTIAVATDGGVSVIKDDGTVVDITSSSASNSFATVIDFDKDNSLWYALGTASKSMWVYSFASLPVGDNVVTYDSKTGTVLNATSFYATGLVASDIDLLVGVTDTTQDVKGLTKKSVGTELGLSFILEDTTTPAKGVVAYATKDYATGAMLGDIRLAALSSDNDTDLVAEDIVQNGDFATGDATGFQVTSGGLLDWDFSGGSAAYSGSELTFLEIKPNGVHPPVGTYVLQAEVSGTYSGVYLNAANGYIGGYASGGVTSWYVNQVTQNPLKFVASVPGFSVSNIKLFRASPDRSVKNKGLITHGTIIKTKETNSDFVWYSGFSASDYLEQPYNSDLDFGTGDFCVMGWVNPTETHSGTVFTRQLVGQAGGLLLRVVNNLLTFYASANTSYVQSATALVALTNNVPAMVTLMRKTGVAYLYVNGVLMASSALTSDLSYPNAILRVGSRNDAVMPWLGSLAMIRISATAHTPEQIAEIYRIENAMRQGYFLLGGTSNAILQLAYDWTTRELHVLTSSGVSTFDMDSWRRVNFEAGSWTKLEANNGMVWKG